MIAALQAIGVPIEVSRDGQTISIPNDRATNDKVFATVNRANANSPEPTELYIANSGTTIRFLTAALSALGGHYRLVGVPRMHERPIGDLVDAIQPAVEIAGGRVDTESPGGCPPVLIQSDGWKTGKMRVGGSVSSQYLSGLMMAGPVGKSSSPIELLVEGELVSRPYVEMTTSVIRSFGANVEILSDAENETAFQISGNYQGTNYEIEPDASAASYFWATAAISGGQITVEGLSRNALQGDVGFCDVLEKMGCQVDHSDTSITVTGRLLHGIDVDMNAISDTVQTLGVVALFADGPTRVRGVAHNRFKETDRIGDLARELRKMGAQVTEHDDGLTIEPPSEVLPATLETYHDHRMAMSLSLAGLRTEGIQILNPSCTSKTYPEFFADLEALTQTAHSWGKQ